jgi:hypothetical protein
MQFISFLVLILLAPGSHTQSKPPTAASGATDDRAIVTPRKVVIVRRAALIKDFPENKTATVTDPIIKRLEGPDSLAKDPVDSTDQECLRYLSG